MGKFYLIGVGVGKTENITVRALNVLKILDKLYLLETETQKSIAFGVAKKYLNNKAEIITVNFMMQASKKEKNKIYTRVAENILEDVAQKKKVGFITIGDPMIYSSAIYILEKLQNKIEVVVVPAVSSFCAAAASLTFPLCFEDETLTIIPATVGIEKIKKFLELCESLVILKAYKNFNEIINLIIEKNLEHNTFAVSNLGLPTERFFTDFKSLKDIKPNYLTTILINKNWNLPT